MALFAFPERLIMLSAFPWACWPFVSVFGEMSVQVLRPILNWVVSFVVDLNILDSRSLLDK